MIWRKIPFFLKKNLFNNTRQLPLDAKIHVDQLMCC